MSTVYEPQEDSMLLAGQVKKFSSGKVLDMGCGSGIQGFTAMDSKKVNSVDFADINDDALKYVQKKRANASVIHSDLFSNIEEKYDTIIFNPPYLPEDPMDDEKLITTGGKKGWEIYDRFLSEARWYLEINGIILLLFSSMTGKRKIDSLVRKYRYEKNLLTVQKLFMEKLFVYMLKQKNDNVFRGHRGIVIIDKKKKTATKSALKDYNSAKEAGFLKLLNRRGIGPDYISHNDKSLTMEYVKGTRIIDYLEKSGKKKIFKILTNILEQTITMDSLMINKMEMTNPYKHIIIRKGRPVMIDFERCAYTQKPQNTTQFIQFICSTRLKYIFDSKKINIDRDGLREIAKKMKGKFSKPLEIMRFIK